MHPRGLSKNEHAYNGMNSDVVNVETTIVGKVQQPSHIQQPSARRGLDPDEHANPVTTNPRPLPIKRKAGRTVTNTSSNKKQDKGQTKNKPSGGVDRARSPTQELPPIESPKHLTRRHRNVRPSCFHDDCMHRGNDTLVSFAENCVDLFESRYIPVVDLTKRLACEVVVRKASVGGGVPRPMIFIDGCPAGWIQEDVSRILQLRALTHRVTGTVIWDREDCFTEGRRFYGRFQWNASGCPGDGFE